MVVPVVTDWELVAVVDGLGVVMGKRVELEARGIVEIVPDPDDRRARIVRFADEANETRRAASKILHYLELKLVERVGLPAYHGLRDALRMDWGEPPKVPADVISAAEVDGVSG